jgi:hypothetical protein
MYEKNVELFKGVERKFAKSIENLGKINFSSKDEDIYEHWDVSVTMQIDVKAIKKNNENIHYVELKNVLGRPGWLYGDAHYFAFETQDYWIMVDKIRLQEFIKDKCAAKEWSQIPSFYKLTQRRERKDIITLVKTIDLMFICDKMIKKDEEHTSTNG